MTSYWEYIGPRARANPIKAVNTAGSPIYDLIAAAIRLCRTDIMKTNDKDTVCKGHQTKDCAIYMFSGIRKFTLGNIDTDAIDIANEWMRLASGN